MLSEQQLAQRAKNIGASEVAALFGLSPWLSRWTLWHQKSGHLTDLYNDNERLEWGNELEPVIAKTLAQRQGWTINKVHRYVKHPTQPGMGASLDFEIKDFEGNPYKGRGAFEIKNTSGWAFKKGWLFNEQGNIIQAPLHYELQLQHQMACTGYQWGAFGVLVDGAKGHVMVRERHPGTIAKIEQAIAAFWASIETGVEPPLDSPIDPKAVALMFGRDGLNEAVMDLSGSVELDQLAGQERALQAVESEATKERALVKAKILHLMSQSEAEQAVTGLYQLSYKEQTRKETVIKASTFRVLRIAPLKVEVEKKPKKGKIE